MTRALSKPALYRGVIRCVDAGRALTVRFGKQSMVSAFLFTQPE